ncbi:MAG: hypothetical protein ACE5IR_14675 [bacterium]
MNSSEHDVSSILKSVRTSQPIQDYSQKYLTAIELQPETCSSRGMVVDIKSNSPSQTVMAFIFAPNGHPVSNSLALQSTTFLASSKILQSLRDELPLNFRFILQTDSSPDFAKSVIQQGGLNHVSTLFGLTEHTAVADDQIGVQAGPLIPSKSSFTLRIFQNNGKSSDLARTQNILVAAQTVISLRQALNRRIDPLIPSVISFSSVNMLNSGSDGIELTGSFQNLEDSDSQHIFDVIENTVHGVSAAQGSQFQIKLKNDVSAIIPEQNTTETLLLVSKEIFNAENVMSFDYPVNRLGGLTEFLKQVPAAILYHGDVSRLINDSEQGKSSGLANLCSRIVKTLVKCALSVCLAA